MEFECNGAKWKIKIVDEATINNEVKDDNTVGLSKYREQEILIERSQKNIIKTLKHELMHVWLYEYGHNQEEDVKYGVEEICEIVASSNKFINEIIDKFKEWVYKNK